jgi:hypothetical protein
MYPLMGAKRTSDDAMMGAGQETRLLPCGWTEETVALTGAQWR